MLSKNLGPNLGQNRVFCKYLNLDSDDLSDMHISIDFNDFELLMAVFYAPELGTFRGKLDPITLQNVLSTAICYGDIATMD